MPNIKRHDPIRRGQIFRIHVVQPDIGWRVYRAVAPQKTHRVSVDGSRFVVGDKLRVGCPAPPDLQPLVFFEGQNIGVCAGGTEELVKINQVVVFEQPGEARFDDFEEMNFIGIALESLLPDELPYLRPIVKTGIFRYNPIEALATGNVSVGDSVVITQRLDSMLKKGLWKHLPVGWKASDELVTAMKVLRVFPFDPAQTDSAVRAEKIVCCLNAGKRISERHS